MPKFRGGSLILLGLLLAAILALGWWNREMLLGLLQAGPPADHGRPPPLVEVAPVERAEIEARLQATGSLKPAETVTITARSRGRVEDVRFSEGNEVSKHQALVLLERNRAQAAVREAAARVSQRARQFERLETLDAKSFVSETELEGARAAASEARAALQVSSEDLADRIIEAPFDGMIGRRLISPGALLEPGTPVASLSRTAPLDLLLDVPGTELARIAPGQRVMATSPAYPQQTFEGRVTFVAPEVTETTRTLALEATFDNADHQLKPGMFMTAELVTDRREILRVPEAAVIAQGPMNHLFVVEMVDPEVASTSSTSKGSESARSDRQPSGQTESGSTKTAASPENSGQDATQEQGGTQEQPGAQEKGRGEQSPARQAKVRRQPVQTGIRRDGWVEITSGLSADEQVVVAGLQSLRDGIAVRISGDQTRDQRQPVAQAPAGRSSTAPSSSKQSPAGEQAADESAESPGSSPGSSSGASATSAQPANGDTP